MNKDKLLILVAGFFIFWAYMVYLSISNNHFKMNDCVQQLGYKWTGRVTNISPLGGIEITYPNPYNSEEPFINAYTKKDQELLIRVSCD